MSYHVRKVDLNQREVVRGLRALGYTVRHCHTVGHGFPDLVIGKFERNLLVEVKRPGERLTADEREFFDEWKGSVIIGTNVEQIHEQFMQLYEKGQIHE
jgi:hypothetical protein